MENQEITKKPVEVTSKAELLELLENEVTDGVMVSLSVEVMADE